MADLSPDEIYWIWQGEPGAPAVSSTVGFAAQEMQLRPGGRVLDLGCARGYYAIEFARRGYRVTGLDISPAFLAEARRRAAAAAQTVEFVQGDMTRLDFAEDFDAVFLWGNTFGLFRDADNRAALAGLARALAPGGAALIETENRQALGEGGGRSWHFGGDDEKLLFLTEDTVDEEARRFGFVVTAVEIATGRRGELAFSWRHYDLEQLRQLAAEAGLRLSAVLGDDPAKIDWGAYASGAPYPFSEEAFGPDAGRRILLYHKQ